MLAPVVLDPLEARVVVGFVDGAHHAQALGPGEGPEPAAQVDRPRRTDVVGVRIGASTARGTMSSQSG